MMDVHLSQRELARMIGTESTARQIEWLNQNGCAFKINFVGGLIVGREMMAEALKQRDTPRKATTPNLSQVR
jgi:Domain of unknown function (DUF4224)